MGVQSRPRSRFCLPLLLGAIAVGLYPVDPADAGAGDAWESQPPIKTARQEVGVAALGGEIYVIGGILGNGSATGLVERFDVAANEWEDVDPLPDDTRLHHIGAAAVNDKVYTIGGLDSGFRGVDDCFQYDATTQHWERAASLRRARGASGVAVLDGKIYAAGGQDGGQTFPYLAVYDPDADDWEELADMPTARNHLAAAAVNGIFYAISGRSGGLRGAMEAYNPSTGRWHPRTPILTPRAGIAAAAFDGRIFVFGGEGNPNDTAGIFPQTEAYNPTTDRWEPRLDMAAPRHGIGVARVGDRLYIPGGSPREGLGVTDTHDAFVPESVPLDQPFLRGDANRDEGVNISDPVFVLVRLFVLPVGFPCEDAADANDDGEIQLADAVTILEFLFRASGPLPDPGTGDSGPDPTTDDLTCSG